MLALLIKNITPFTTPIDTTNTETPLFRDRSNSSVVHDVIITAPSNSHTSYIIVYMWLLCIILTCSKDHQSGNDVFVVALAVNSICAGYQVLLLTAECPVLDIEYFLNASFLLTGVKKWLYTCERTGTWTVYSII